MEDYVNVSFKNIEGKFLTREMGQSRTEFFLTEDGLHYKSSQRNKLVKALFVGRFHIFRWHEGLLEEYIVKIVRGDVKGVIPVYD